MVVIPPALQPGDKIGIIAPAGHLVDRNRFLAGCSIIRQMGFEIAEPEKTWPGYGYLADNDSGRVEEFHRVWATPEIKAVFALRGGYGSLRIIDKLDFELIRENPKFLVGFSDITIMHDSFYRQAGLASLHGPVLSSLVSSETSSLERLYQCLTGNWHKRLHEDIEIIRGGVSVRGRLRGGNLSSLATLIGTPWEPDFSSCILFLEDCNEPPYRIDRLLTQCRYSGLFDQVAGIIIGDFMDDRDFDRNEKLRRHEFVWNRMSELTDGSSMPIWGNFPIGHCSRNITLPVGVTAIMNSAKRTLEFPVNQDQD